MWEEMERSPVLAAPGSNDYAGLIASSTVKAIGGNLGKVQGLRENEESELCEQYRPLTRSLAARYSGRGISFKDLEDAAELGFVRALRKCGPSRRSTLGAYAKYWAWGEILELFKPKGDALGFGRRVESLNEPIFSEGKRVGERIDLLVDDSIPAKSLDLSALSEKDQHIVQARACGFTLRQIGSQLGISPERVRQREGRAYSKLRSLGLRWHHIDFQDTEPPKHLYCDPKLSRQIYRHRLLAPHLAELRGGAPIRNERGRYGGPVIHAWRRP